MEIKLRILMVVGTLMICLVSATYAAQGTATYYERPYVPSSCYGRQNMGDFVAGVNDEIWNGRKACGTNYRVKCIGGVNNVPRPCKDGASVVVKIVDYCSQCNGTINLSDAAFSSIANLKAGKVKVEFVRV